GALAGSQYTPRSGTLTFSSGQTSNSFSVPVFDDHIVQTNEVFQRFGLQLSNPAAGGSLGSQSSATVTIGDVDAALQFVASTFSVLESDLLANITVERLGFSESTITVQYSTADGTATAGHDYTSQSALLTFNPGELTKVFSIPLLQDTFVVPVETVKLTL